MRHPNSAAGHRRAATPFTARPLALALHVIVFAGASALAAHAPDAWAQGTAAAPAARSYDIPAGPLNSVLTRFSREAGVYLVGAGSLAEGKTSPGLKGSYPVQAGFATLLAGTGLEAFRQSDDSYGLRPAPKAAPAPLPKAPAPTAEPVEARLPAVNVKARLERSATTEGTGSYTTRAASLGKTEHSLREIPQSVSVVTRQQMEDRNAVTLEDVMVYATGIGAYNNEGQGTSSFYARGYSGLQTQYDGIANNSGGMGSQADVAVYDRIEIQRGPAGLLQGSGNPAGTVNLVRKRGQRDFALAGSLSAGSWSNYGGDLDVSGPLNETGSVRGRAVVAARDRAFFYDQAHKRSQTGYLALDIDLAPRTTLGVGLLSQHETATPTAGVVAYSNGVMPDWPRSTNLNAPWGNGTTRIDEASADLTHALDNDWKLKAGARYRQTAFAYQTARLQSALDPATGRASTLRYEHQGIDEHYYAGDVNLSGVFNAFGRRHEVLVGANAEHNDYDYAWAVSSVSGSFDVNNLPYDRSQVGNAVPQEGYKTRQSGLYGMTRLKLQDSLTLLLGGRRSNYQSSSRSIAAGTTQAWSTDTEAKGKFTPYGGLIWDLTKQLSWYASYADVFMPQATKDWQGDLLKPRVGWQGETGVKGEFFDGALNATLAFFRIRDRNRAMTDPDPSHVCNGGTCSMAAGLMQNQGWELDVSGSPLTGLELSAGYTHNITKYLKDGNAARQGTSAASSTYSPRDAFKAWGNYRFGAGALTGWTAGGGLQVYGRTEGWGGVRQAAYSVASLQAGYQLSRHWKATLTVNNLFDTTYFRQINGINGYTYYGEPRNAMLTLRANY